MTASLGILVIRSSLVDWQSMKKECRHARHNWCLIEFIDWRYNVGIFDPALCDHILQEFNTLYLTRLRTYKIALPPQTKPRRGGGLRQINTCRKDPLQVNFLDNDIWHLLSSSLIFLRLQVKHNDWRLFTP
jgi:hypothetical protein